MLKSELRKHIRARKRQFPEEHLRELSLPVIERLMDNPKIREARTILMYYSLADEVYTHEVIDKFVAYGKTVLLPVVLDGDNMELRLYTGPDDLRQGCYGIMEPRGRLFDEYDIIDVAVVPGMSFDQYGNRLGRGKGYYDRFLAKVPRIYKIGVCFDFQKVGEVPTEGTDIKMDEVV